MRISQFHIKRFQPAAASNNEFIKVPSFLLSALLITEPFKGNSNVFRSGPKLLKKESVQNDEQEVFRRRLVGHNPSLSCNDCGLQVFGRAEGH
jgi:hypothetical protein